MLALATFLPMSFVFLSCYCLFGLVARGLATGGRRKEGQEGKGREGWGVDTVVVITGGGIVSIIMIIKLGPNIAAYEACITLFLIFHLSVWCWC
jgi:hypothetical protein